MHRSQSNISGCDGILAISESLNLINSKLPIWRSFSRAALAIPSYPCPALAHLLQHVHALAPGQGCISFRVRVAARSQVVIVSGVTVVPAHQTLSNLFTSGDIFEPFCPGKCSKAPGRVPTL